LVQHPPTVALVDQCSRTDIFGGSAYLVIFLVLVVIIPLIFIIVIVILEVVLVVVVKSVLEL
jgi:hypothetical protein